MHWKVNMENKCRHCGKKLLLPKIRIAIIRKGCTSYFYYPSHSCKSEDGEMKMLINKIDALNDDGEKYELEAISAIDDALVLEDAP